MASPPAPETVQAVRRFSRFYTRRLGVLNQGLLESPHSLTEVRVLFELAHRVGATASDLAEELAIDPGYLSRILAGFETEGFVKRRPSEEDRRERLLSLSPSGRRVFKTLDERSSRQVASMLAEIAEHDRRDLVAAIGTIERVLDGGPDASDATTATFVMRPHRPGDIGLVTHRHGVLYASECGFDETFEALVAEILVRFARKHDLKRERLWIAERDGVFAGCIMCAAACPTVAQLRLLLVEPAMRGHGLGATLVAECTRFARTAGYRKMILWTQGNLVVARRLYEQAGFGLASEESHCSYGQDLVAQWWERVL